MTGLYKARKRYETLSRRRDHLDRRAHSPEEYSGRNWDLAEVAALNYALELIERDIAQREKEETCEPTHSGPQPQPW